MPEKRPLLVLFDGNALVHRAYHALPPLSLSKTGELVGAVYGFTSMLLKALNDLKPEYAAVAFDRPAPTFRHVEFDAYKAQRPKMADDLVPQFARVRQIVKAFDIPIHEIDGYEADDVIGTLARQAEKQDIDVVIVTGDADTMQLVSPSTKVLISRRGVSDTALFDEEGVQERYGVKPSQITDLKGLSGDSSDNIPGVPSVGEKTAVKLIQQFDSVEGIYEHIDEVTPARLQEALRKNEEVARQSKRLATIVLDVPISLDPAACKLSEYDRSQVVDIFRELEFKSLLERLPEVAKGTRQDWIPAQGNGQSTKASPTDKQLSLFAMAEAPGVAAETVRQPSQHSVVNTPQALADLTAKLWRAKRFVFDTETTGIDTMRADLVGVAIGLSPTDTYYIPVGHRRLSGFGLLEQPSATELPSTDQLSLDEVIASLKPIMESAEIAKVAHNAKYDSTILANCDIDVRGLGFDTMLAAYLLNEKTRGLKELAFNRFGVEMTPISTLIGKGDKQISMADVPVDVAAAYSCADVEMTDRLHRLLEPELREGGLWPLFTDVEMPLVPVLVAMEREGIALDTALLRGISQDLHQQMVKLELDIYNSIGHKFNINSTKQLGALLFDELKLPKARKTKTGYSTDAAVLDDLKGAHPVIDLLLLYRQLAKLKSTYVDALPALINPRTGRVHTSFNQMATTTGRLSSSDPNLQNIPIRTELGRLVRRAFVAGRPGWKLLSADYSQVELRILAHITQDPNLLAAFTAGEDIHTATASLVFGMPLDQVTSNMRRVAKTVNFGVIYGMSDYGLSQGTDLSRRDAAQFIEAYFQRYRKVKEYVEDTKKQVRELGYVQTLLNRRRYVHDIRSGNAQVRQAAERMAINMPIQGTAADIIKIAMVRLHDKTRSLGLQSKMLLQVHDELLFEAPVEEIDVLLPLVRETMETALPMSVPLKVDAKIGPNWDEMEGA